MAAARRRKRQPSSPEEIALRAAMARQAARQSASDPSTWGVSASQQDLPAFEAVAPPEQPARGRYRPAKRLDAFGALHAGGGLDDGQLAASERLTMDWAERIGIQTKDSWKTGVIDGGGSQELVNDRMLAAADRIRDVFGRIGRRDAKLLEGLVQLVVLEHNEVTTFWRGKVQMITGEAEIHCQGATVRGAVENLRLAYAEIDQQPRTPRLGA